MVAGHLQERNGYFYMVLSFKDVAGKRKTPWIPTGLSVKGNKKRAEAMLQKTREDFIPDAPLERSTSFATYLEQWLRITKSTVALTTFASYSELTKGTIINVDEMGNIIKPNYVSDGFKRLLKKNKLRVIRFHDLRHSCASLLLAVGVPMKQIQEWLGHSDFSTRANIYAHLEYHSKITSAQAMLSELDMKGSILTDESGRDNLLIGEQEQYLANHCHTRDQQVWRGVTHRTENHVR